MSNEMSCPEVEAAECRAKIELRGLRNCLMPRDDDALRKAMTLILVVGWLIWSIGLGTDTLNKGGAVLWGFTIYELFSFAVIYAFARLHDLEVKRLLGLEESASDKLDRWADDDDTARRRRREQTRERGGFRYGDDRQQDDTDDEAR